MNIPFIDLKRHYQEIKEEIGIALQRVVDSQHFILGNEVKELENKVAEYCRVKHAIGVASGTDALLLSLKSIGAGLKKTDKVITTPFTFFATVGAIVNVGAQPLFVDIDPETFNIDPQKIEEHFNGDPGVRNEIKAILPVHLYGQLADNTPIQKIAHKYSVKLIEDAAQSFGAEYQGIKAGSIGDMGCFSFFPTKNLAGFGDGGMVVTNDDELAEKVRMLRVHGSKTKYHHPMIGYNSRLDELHAATLRVKLSHIDQLLDERRNIAHTYGQKLQNLKGIRIPEVRAGNVHTYNLYTIIVENGKRDDLQLFLNQKGIYTAIYYPLPLHLQECFHYLGYKKGAFPNAEKASTQVLSLPLFPGMQHTEIEYVCEQVNKFLS